MGELTKKEKEVIEFLIENVSLEVFRIEQEERDKGRLDYSLCSDYDEKQEVTKKKIDKFKKKIAKCPPAIAGFLSELTIPDHIPTDIYELRDILTSNFLFEHFDDLIESLCNENIEELQKYQFEYVVKSRGFNYKLLKKFIEGICDVNQYLVYKSFLDIPRNENISYDHIIEKLNNAFFRLEAFMKGSFKEYYHFDFNTAFTELFYFTRKVDNFTYDNCKRIGQYWGLTEQIGIDYEKSDFENLKALENKAFCNDCEVIMSVNWDRLKEFNSFATPDEIEEQTKKKSISDFIKSTSDKPKVIEVNLIDKIASLNDEENPYPRIFKDSCSYAVFKRLYGEFSNTKENLSNYSFVFHKMTYDGLIHFDLKQSSYFEFLDNLDINISRIKPLADIGKRAFRESIYIGAK